MTEDARHRVAVVSGGTTGIGFSIVQELLEAGFRVALFGQDARHVEEAGQALAQRFHTARFLALRVDLTKPEEVAGFFAEVSSHWHAPDTMICNAGISPKSPDGRTALDQLGLDEWHDVLAVNLTGALICCQAVLPAMSQQGFGRIILIGSIAGRAVPKIAGTAYSVSKAGLSGLARSLVAETSGTGVTVNVVAPGRIITGMAGNEKSPVNRAALARIPVGLLGRPGDISALIGFLASSKAGFIHGAVIDVNGGEFVPL